MDTTSQLLRLSSTRIRARRARSQLEEALARLATVVHERDRAAERVHVLERRLARTRHAGVRHRLLVERQALEALVADLDAVANQRRTEATAWGLRVRAEEVGR